MVEYNMWVLICTDIEQLFIEFNRSVGKSMNTSVMISPHWIQLYVVIRKQLNTSITYQISLCVIMQHVTDMWLCIQQHFRGIDQYQYLYLFSVSVSNPAQSHSFRFSFMRHWFELALIAVPSDATAFTAEPQYNHNSCNTFTNACLQRHNKYILLIYIFSVIIFDSNWLYCTVFSFNWTELNWTVNSNGSLP